MSLTARKALNNMSINRLCAAEQHRCKNMSAVNKARMIAIRGELPEPTPGGPFESEDAYTAYWDMVEMLDPENQKTERQVSDLAKIIIDIMEQIIPIGESQDDVGGSKAAAPSAAASVAETPPVSISSKLSRQITNA